jgi:outer membrane protein assembly factor BamB
MTVIRSTSGVIMTQRALRSVVLVAAGCVLGVAATYGSDWPHWRGPDYNGISSEKGWIDHWPAAGPVVQWKAKVGTGFSSFSVADGRVYTMGNANNADTVYCLNAESGEEVWKYSYPSDLGDKFFEGGPTATPTVDGNRVYTIGRWGDLFCFDAAKGTINWSTNLAKPANLKVPTWGLSGSTLVLDGALFLNLGESGLALDKTDGHVLWSSPNRDPGYSTPLPWKTAAGTALLFGGASAYRAVDAKTGTVAWKLQWLTSYGINASDPVIAGDHIFISTGYGKGAVLIKPGAAEPEVVWKSKVMRNQFNSSILLNGFLYGVDGDVGQNAALKCVELATGTEKWSEASIGSGALTAADGKLIVLSEKGELMVALASPDGFKPMARAQILQGKCWTTPVLANRRLYCRDAEGDAVALDLRVHKD